MSTPGPIQNQIQVTTNIKSGRNKVSGGRTAFSPPAAPPPPPTTTTTTTTTTLRPPSFSPSRNDRHRHQHLDNNDDDEDEDDDPDPEEYLNPLEKVNALYF